MTCEARAARLICCALWIQSLLVGSVVHAVTLQTGDIVVTDNETGRVVRIDSIDSTQKELPCSLAIEPHGLAIDRAGIAFVVSVPSGPSPPNAGELIRIGPTGCDSLSAGGDLVLPDDVTIGLDGELLVNTLRCASCDPTEPPAIIAIDPISGVQTPIAFGGLLVDPENIAVAPNGDLFVADDGCAICQPAVAAAVIRIATDGSQESVSSGGFLGNVSGMALEPSGTLLVVDRGCRSCVPAVPARLLRIDPDAPPLVNQFSVSEAPPVLDFDGVAMGAGGEIFVGVENDALDTGGVVQIGPGGALIVISAAGQLDDVDGIAVALLPEPARSWMLLAAVTSIAILRSARSGTESPRPDRGDR